jgi:hypothetical protein
VVPDDGDNDRGKEDGVHDSEGIEDGVHGEQAARQHSKNAHPDAEDPDQADVFRGFALYNPGDQGDVEKGHRDGTDHSNFGNHGAEGYQSKPSSRYSLVRLSRFWFVSRLIGRLEIDWESIGGRLGRFASLTGGTAAGKTGAGLELMVNLPLEPGKPRSPVAFSHFPTSRSPQAHPFTPHIHLESTEIYGLRVTAVEDTFLIK